MWAPQHWTRPGKCVGAQRCPEPGGGARQQRQPRRVTAACPGQWQESWHLQCACWCFLGNRASWKVVGSLLKLDPCAEDVNWKGASARSSAPLPAACYREGFHGGDWCSFNSTRSAVSHMRQPQTLLHRQVTACNALAKHKATLPSFSWD